MIKCLLYQTLQILAAAMAGTDLFVHIKYMMYTTIPSFLITLLIFFFIGIATHGIH